MENGFQIEKINHVFLPTGNRTKAFGFWKKTLGLDSMDGLTQALRVGDAHLFVEEPHGEEKEGGESEFGFSPEAGRSYLFLKVKGIDALHRKLEEKGVRILSGPKEAHWGPKVMTAEGPDGVPVLFIE